MITLPSGVYRYLSRLKTGVRTLADGSGGGGGPVKLATGYGAAQVNAGPILWNEPDIVPMTAPGVEFGSRVIPASVWAPGVVLHIKAQGSISVINGAEAYIYAYLDGATNSNVIEIPVGENTSGSTNNWGFAIDSTYIVRSVSAETDVTMDVQFIKGPRGSGSAPPVSVVVRSFQNLTLDLTQDCTLRMTAQWSLANGGSLVLNNYEMSIDSYAI